MQEIKVKFCGLKNQNEVEVCQELGVNYMGFVFHKLSPRYISFHNFSKLDFTHSPKIVAVFQNPSKEMVNQALFANHVDYIQVHGNNEILEDFKGKVGIIKALPEPRYINTQESNCDFLLFDGTEAGSGKVRDFSFARNIKSSTPYFLAGGINIHNYKEAIQYTNYIDLSSGIEDVRGIKSITKMREFMTAVRQTT